MYHDKNAHTETKYVCRLKIKVSYCHFSKICIFLSKTHRPMIWEKLMVYWPIDRQTDESVVHYYLSDWIGIGSRSLIQYK